MRSKLTGLFLFSLSLFTCQTISETLGLSEGDDLPNIYPIATDQIILYEQSPHVSVQVRGVLKREDPTGKLGSVYPFVVLNLRNLADPAILSTQNVEIDWSKTYINNFDVFLQSDDLSKPLPPSRPNLTLRPGQNVTIPMGSRTQLRFNYCCQFDPDPKNDQDGDWVVFSVDLPIYINIAFKRGDELTRFVAAIMPRGGGVPNSPAPGAATPAEGATAQ